MDDASQSLSLKRSARTATATTTSNAARMIGIMAVSCWKGGSVPPRLMRVWGSVLVAEVVDKDHDCDHQIDGRKNGGQHGDLLS